TFLCH
ncbi:hypothetical protein D039_2055B, partial [Vibrio parahaemolyticus EKP-028]